MTISGRDGDTSAAPAICRPHAPLHFLYLGVLIVLFGFGIPW